jgi:hypothetical protein
MELFGGARSQEMELRQGRIVLPVRKSSVECVCR